MAARLGIQVINPGGRIVAGSSEYISVLLTDQSGIAVTDQPTTGTAQPLPPPGTVVITLTTPSGQIAVSQAAMIPDSRTAGFYNYTYPTAATSEHGMWRASFIGADGFGNTVYSPSRPIFEVGGA